jgi:hypothetical protein
MQFAEFERMMSLDQFGQALRALAIEYYDEEYDQIYGTSIRLLPAGQKHEMFY